MNLTGPDHQLVPALQLLAHFLHSAKGDRDALKDVKDEDKVERKSFGKQKDDVLRPVIHRIAYGEKSSYLTQLNKKEVKSLADEDLLTLFRELQQYDCELFYCGRQSVELVATQSQQMLPLAQCTKPQADTFRPFLQYDEPVVYFFNVPKSRQNYVISYDAIGALPTQEDRVNFKLWDEYFGGGMSSVLFQNVREFRSLAYATGGSAFTTSLAQHSDASQGYVTVTGTQADKTLEALSTVDSLLRQLPMKENNLEAARQSVLNDIQNNYPTFRTLGKYVANQLRDGYVSDPNTGIARGIPSVTSQDIMQFHQ
jgi:predicted Zn-dependent peptidase